MTSFYYETNCGRYMLCENGKHIDLLIDEVAIAYSLNCEDGLYTLQKHGSPERVNLWTQAARSELLETGNPFYMQIADEIKVIQGKFDLQDLNSVLDNSNLLKNLLAKWSLNRLDGEKGS